jgi:hypothetical protein
MSECPVFIQGYGLTKHWEYGERLERKRKKKIQWILDTIRAIAERHYAALRISIKPNQLVHKGKTAIDPLQAEESFFLHTVIGNSLGQLINLESGREKHWSSKSTEHHEWLETLWEYWQQADYDGTLKQLHASNQRSKRLVKTIPWFLPLLPRKIGSISEKEYEIVEIICRETSNAVCTVRSPEGAPLV